MASPNERFARAVSCRHGSSQEEASNAMATSLIETAGEENRTPVSSLGSWRSTIELHPRET